MNELTTNDKLREHFRRESRNDQTLTDDEPLLTSGFLDSIAIVRLLTYIEQEFDVEIRDADFDPDNYETIATIATLIERVRA